MPRAICGGMFLMSEVPLQCMLRKRNHVSQRLFHHRGTSFTRKRTPLEDPIVGLCLGS